jgi:hypothetical protein
MPTRSCRYYNCHNPPHHHFLDSIFQFIGFGMHNHNHHHH